MPMVVMMRMMGKKGKTNHRMSESRKHEVYGNKSDVTMVRDVD